MRKHSVFHWIAIIVVSVGFGFLLGTAIRSGLLFQLDPDEWAHAHASYLIAHGFAPYNDFIFIYTPLFHWLISPVFFLVGFTAEAMTSVRWLMVSLFLLRTFISFVLVALLFGKRIAGVFLFLFVADPFTVFTAMQIRPDNLMMLLFTAGLVLLFEALKSKHRAYMAMSGLLLSGACLVLVKIAPSVLVIGIVLLLMSVKRVNRWIMLPFIAGCFVPVIALYLYILGTGNLPELLQQVFVYAASINNALAYPVPLKNFYLFQHPGLYDIYGSPGVALFLFEYCLPPAAAVGMVIGVCTLFRKNIPQAKAAVIRILAASFIVQAIALLFIHSVFIQYFLPVSWLLSVFASVAVVSSVDLAKRIPLVYGMYIPFVCFACAVVGWQSAQKNIARSLTHIGKTEEWFRQAWRDIPEDEAVYPNIAFRPLAHPLPYGYYLHDLPESILRRLPPLTATLDKSSVNYILMTYEWKAMPEDFLAYVERYFKRVGPDLYKRKE